MKNVLKYSLDLPDKITFGSDAYPYSSALGSEETYWLGVYSSRDALTDQAASSVTPTSAGRSRLNMPRAGGRLRQLP